MYVFDQILAGIGALLCLIPFSAVQLKRMQTESIPYQLMNLAGSAALTTSAILELQFGFIVLESTWALFSLIGITRVLRSGT